MQRMSPIVVTNSQLPDCDHLTTHLFDVRISSIHAASTRANLQGPLYNDLAAAKFELKKVRLPGDNDIGALFDPEL